MKSRLIVWSVLLLGTATAQAQSQIEYETVAQARQALLATPGVEAKDEEGWLIVNQGPGVAWSFAPRDHEAFPSVGKRQLVQRADGRFEVVTTVLCEAEKAACDRLLQSYRDLDKAMMESLGRRGTD